MLLLNYNFEELPMIKLVDIMQYIFVHITDEEKIHL